MVEWDISGAGKYLFGRWFWKVTWSKAWIYNLNTGRSWRIANNRFLDFSWVWSLPLVLTFCEYLRKSFLSPSPVVTRAQSQINSSTLTLESVRHADSHAPPRPTESETKPQVAKVSHLSTQSVKGWSYSKASFFSPYFPVNQEEQREEKQVSGID